MLTGLSFRIPGERYVTVKVDHIPSNRIMSLSLYDSKQNQLLIHLNNPGQTTLKAEKLLQAGHIWSVCQPTAVFNTSNMKFRMMSEPLVGGFRDIAQHWAKGPDCGYGGKKDRFRIFGLHLPSESADYPCGSSSDFELCI